MLALTLTTPGWVLIALWLLVATPTAAPSAGA
jgi:hypothetical protein